MSSRSRSGLLLASVGVACILVGGASAARAGFADFDDLAEGFYGDTLTTGGITFFDVDEHLSTEGGELAVDDVSGAYALIPEFVPSFSSPNVLHMTAITLGPGASFSRFGELRMTTGQIASFASLDLFFSVDAVTIGNSIALEAYLGNDLVATDSVLLQDCLFQSDSLSILDVEFDTLRLTASGPGPDSFFIGAVDNVLIIPEPSSLLLVGLSSLLVLRRRRRTV